MNDLVDSERLLALLTSHQGRLMAYLRTLVANRADAEELLQETNLCIWRHADEFELGTDFASWALRVAYFRVLDWRKRQARTKLVFDDALVESLAVAAQSADSRSSRRLEALESCMKKLSSQDHELITQLYSDSDTTPQGLAECIGRSNKGIYASLKRIRLKLLDCVRRTLVAEGYAR